MSNVTLLLIDGVRPDALRVTDCPNIRALRERGAWSMRASAVMPSITLPCIMSIFHSLSPARHGVRTNDWVPMAEPVPGLIDLAQEAGLYTASFYNWEPLRDLSRPGSLGLSYFRKNVDDLEGGGDQVIADAAARLIVSERPDFAFVYLGTVDVAGHIHGWMSDEYLAQLERVDRAVGTLLDALPAGSTVLMQSYHGGHDHMHGTDAPEDMTVPWMVAGPAVKPGYEIQAHVSLLDTAPTLARILGLSPHPEWEGRCVEEVFRAAG